MTKYEQKCENLAVAMQFDKYLELSSSRKLTVATSEKLRSCSATVITFIDAEHGNIVYHALCSYRTIVAFIDAETGICYDVLRKVYGYTSTSAQHISKFKRDYHATDCKTWREV